MPSVTASHSASPRRSAARMSGFMAVAQAQMRRIPGRLVGMTLDHDERRAYTLTLQAREQHIRREHATSNICTNHALIALAATVYMAHMGAGGMRAVAEVSAQRAHHLANLLTAIDGLSLAHPSTPFLWEFVLRTPRQRCSVREGAARARHRRGAAARPLRSRNATASCSSAAPSSPRHRRSTVTRRPPLTPSRQSAASRWRTHDRLDSRRDARCRVGGG